MRLNVYTVLDKAVEAHMPPFCARADGEASRMFAASLKDSRQFQAPPSDLSLFCIGHFDDVSGTLECLNAPRRVVTGVEVLSSAGE